MNTKIKIFENIALSNHDILNLLSNKCNIILYPDLYKYNSINEILEPYDSCIILYEAKPKYGHWCAINKINNNDIEFFNPYGGLVDNSLNYIPNSFRKKTNQLYPYLTKLMYNSPYNLFYNEFKFQKKGYDIKTCGRHCVIRTLLKKLDIYEYKELLDELCKLYRINYDGVVTILTI